MANEEIEDAYILIMKYLNVFSFIQKSDDFKEDSKYYKAMLGKQPKDALKIAENLHKNLSEYYSMVKNIEASEHKKEKGNFKNSNLNIEMPDMRVQKESKSTVTSAKLFTMLRDGITKVLLMDTRPQLDFESSRIKDNMMNIPDEIITTGFVILYRILIIF